ncbi:MAG: DUF2288 domain-containing protein [Pseudomonadota bacterium]
MNEPDELLRAKLNTETGRLAWKELERHFARGVVIRVAGDLDLVEAAFRVSRDDKAAVQAWMDAGQLRRAEIEDAKDWHERQAVFWAVVVAPWVLIQEIEAGGEG